MNERRSTLMWKLIVVLFSAASVGKTLAQDASSEMLFFDLPSLSMTLDVEKTDNAIIPFQDQLKESMEGHLEKFYENKLLTTGVGIPKFVDVDLESQLLWKELWVGPKALNFEVANHTYSENNFVKKYEVKGIFNCKMRLQIDPATTISGEEKSVFVPETLINIFFLEAFQSDYYWDMMHDFLTTPLLQDIITADVKVMDAGFVHPYDDNGDLLFESDDDFYGRGMEFKHKVSPIAIIASAVAIFFLFAICVIWYYLFFVLKGDTSRFVWRKKKKGRSRDDASLKGSSRTGSTNSEDDADESGEYDEDEDDDDSFVGWATANLDVWASSITSIPLRDVEKKRRRKRNAKVVQRPYFRPCQEHSSNLGCITEADNESWCSSVKSSRSNRSSKSSKNRAYSRSRTRKTESRADSNIIYEDDAEEDEEQQQQYQHQQAQQSPLLTQRQLIKLMPSEDEVEDFRNNHKHNSGFEI
eukprot:CAMPEP_0116136512 /NCGR_PEP_ID=MMETSP0329-20121206/11762_1 /TAXON_ID=697910 /ORGANISM="Pseudo-nitzschia arenysensis, Strain B593" /LENGTH=470 /DNA_ID=CAMNT_0003631381 /DNA_START=70 /DNA_END=1482 /DNA_ORIENTATION=+